MGKDLPIGSSLQFVVKSTKNQEINITDFKAELTLSDRPPSKEVLYNKTHPWKDIVIPVVCFFDKICCFAVPSQTINQEIMMEIYDADEKLKTTLPLFKPNQQQYAISIKDS